MTLLDPEALPVPPSSDGRQEQHRLMLLLAAGCLALLAVWGLEVSREQLSAWDRYAYPTLLLVLGSCVALLRLAPARAGLVRLMAVGSFNAYIPFTLVFSLLLPEGKPDEYQLLSGLYWMPLAYGTSFIFLPIAGALALSAAVYSITFGVLMWQIHLGDTSHWPAYLVPMMHNLAVAQVVYVVVLTTISRLRSEASRSQAKLEAMRQIASTDPLTGLLNRRAMHRHLSAALALVQRNGPPMSAVLIDVDHFKQVNDEGGHAQGDDVLVEVAARLKRQLRASDVLARWGGEEFLVLASATPGPSSVELAERLRRAMASQPFGVGRQITASFGVAQAVADDSVESLIRRADAALYEAKRGGRNRVCLGAPPNQPQRVVGVTSM